MQDGPSRSRSVTLGRHLSVSVSGHLIFMAVSGDVLLGKKVKLDDGLRAREKTVCRLSRRAAESGQGRGHCLQQV